MAVVMRSKPLIPSIFVEKSLESPSMTYRPRYSEAPDAGFRSCESPEHRNCGAESIEAGQGRFSILETDFTHGRSRS